MSDRPEYIQLEANDDMAHLRDRLSFIRGRRVLVIWPETGTALHRKLDIVLIQREAKRRNVQLALVTHDQSVIQHAQDLGISTFETIGAAEGGRWRRTRPKIFTQRHHQPDTELSTDALMEVASRVRPTQRRISPLRFFVERALIVLLLLGVVGGTLYIVVPSATVTLTLASEQISTEFMVIADPSLTDVDVEAARIPATTLRAEVQTVGTVSTTGVSALGDAPAIGIVTFTNQSLTNVTIPPETQVATSGAEPVLFRTTAVVTLRGGIGQTEEVPVQALTENAGDAGNVPSGTITVVIGDLATQVSVTNTSATTGGDTRRYPVVTQEDRDRLLALVRGQLQSSAYEEMRASLSDTQLIVIETIRIAEERSDWTTYDHETGDITPTLSLTMRAVVEAIVIDDRFTRQIVFARLSAQKPAGKVLIADTFAYTRGQVVNVQESLVTFSATGTMTADAVIDTTQLAERIAGKTREQAQQIIAASANLAADIVPDFTQMPPDWPHLPLLPIRISIQTLHS